MFIFKGTEELNRLRELRLANLRHLMKACVIELEEIWTNCFVSTDYQQNFRKSMSLECTEENLSRLEGEVQKWKRFKSSHQCFYDALTVWLDTLQQIKSIEVKFIPVIWNFYIVICYYSTLFHR